MDISELCPVPWSLNPRGLSITWPSPVIWRSASGQDLGVAAAFSSLSSRKNTPQMLIALQTSEAERSSPQAAGPPVGYSQPYDGSILLWKRLQYKAFFFF